LRLEPDRFTWKRLSRAQVKRESVSTLLIESKIHLSVGDLPGLVSDSIKNDLALGALSGFQFLLCLFPATLEFCFHVDDAALHVL
jgi:hypothetical protein